MIQKSFLFVFSLGIFCSQPGDMDALGKELGQVAKKQQIAHEKSMNLVSSLIDDIQEAKRRMEGIEI
jgi:hypothetical protein